jgi:hypothetical protein
MKTLKEWQESQNYMGPPPADDPAADELDRLRQENEELKEKLRVAMTDFDYLERRSASALVKMKEQIFLDLDVKLADSWATVAQAIELVIKGEREPQQIAKFWNKLDAKFWRAINAPNNGKKINVE